jgi:hypothetical protein
MRLPPPIDLAISAAAPSSTQPMEPNMVASIPHLPSELQQLGSIAPPMMSTEGHRGSPPACALPQVPPAFAVPHVLVNGSRQHAVRSPAGSGGLQVVVPHVMVFTSELPLPAAARPEAPVSAPFAGFSASSLPQPPDPIALINVTIRAHGVRCLLMLAILCSDPPCRRATGIITTPVALRGERIPDAWHRQRSAVHRSQHNRLSRISRRLLVSISRDEAEAYAKSCNEVFVAISNS